MKSRTLLGRTPPLPPNVNTLRLNANVLIDVTTGTPRIFAAHCPQGATESAMM